MVAFSEISDAKDLSDELQGFSQLSESGGAKLQIIPKVGGKKGNSKQICTVLAENQQKWEGS